MFARAFITTGIWEDIRQVDTLDTEVARPLVRPGMAVWVARVPGTQILRINSTLLLILRLRPPEENLRAASWIK